MAVKTTIQWADTTVNPTMGCDGCELRDLAAGVRKCYAGTLHDRFGGTNPGYSPSFEVLTLHPGRMADAAKLKDLKGTARKDKPWLNGAARTIFVSDMGDLLSKAISFEHLKTEIIENVVSPAGQRHNWLWLTKRPNRMAAFSNWLLAKGIAWPNNLWAGTSITSAATTPRIPQLLKVGGPNTVRFVSVEPQHEPIDLTPWLSQLDWLIQGRESGHDAKPFHVEWAIDLINQCKAAGTPYFLKQLGANPFVNGVPLELEDGHGGDWAAWPEAIRVREMPTVVRVKG